MERTQIYLTAEQKARLEAIARARAVPMADVVRDAVDRYLSASESGQLLEAINRTFGTVKEWKDRDGVEIQRELRAMWEEGDHGKKQD